MLARERHLHRLLDGLDATRPRCALCGYADPAALLRMSRSLLELHHLGGVAHGGPEVIVCRNCHAILTLAQQPYAHLLKGNELPNDLKDALWMLDQAGFQERLAVENRKRAYAIVERLAQTPRGRRLLRHPRK
jgi:hypothetical protein